MREYKRKYRETHREKIRASERKRYADNLHKERERSRKYRLDNPEKRHESQRKSQSKHYDKYIECNRKYLAENIDKIRERGRLRRAENPEKFRERERRRYAEHPEIRLSESHLRRAVLRTSVADAPTAEQIATLMKDPCVYCGDPSEHIDHVIPLSRGGDHVLDNLVPSCAKCNLSKWAKLPVLEWNGRFSKLSKPQPTTVQEKQ